MNILINYADSKYESARKWNTCTGRWIGKFDRIYEFKPEDIDENFRNQHKEILSIKRGNGAWLWKSYFLKKVLDDSNDGDYIMYLDSGAFFIRDPRILFEYIDDNNPIFVTDIPLIESNWTKPECFDIMDACKLINVKFFYAIPINTFYELKALVDYGCCDVRIEAPLTHMLDKLEDYDITIRMTPNIAYHGYIPRENGIIGSWVRPEDVSYYEPYVDVFEFEDCDAKKE